MTALIDTQSIIELSKKAETFRKDFPVLFTKVNDTNLVYLDNGATTQKPKSVIDRVTKFLSEEYATIHRGVYFLSQQATEFYDEARRKVQSFLSAKLESEIIFTKGTTEAINLVAHSFVTPQIKSNQTIVISAMEHHANIVPWQEVCKTTGALLKVIPMDDRGVLNLDVLDTLLKENDVFIVAVNHISNALGTINDIQKIISLAKQNNAYVLIDGAQAVAHTKVDVSTLNTDFYCFSSHKLFGPTGVGVLYAKNSHLECMRPYQTGGDMIETVTFEKTTYAKAPSKFEAGTPAITEVIGLGVAIDYVKKIGFEFIESYEKALLDYATYEISKIDGVTIIGTAPNKASVLSFVIDGVHPHDIGTILDEQGVAIRAGHHCAQPVMQYFKIPATARATFTFYNTKEDVDALILGIKKVKEIML